LAFALGALLLSWAGFQAVADQVEMQNGDRYQGRVLSLNSNLLIIQSEVLGTLRLPRAKVALVALGDSLGTNWMRSFAATNSLASAPTAASAEPAPEVSAIGRQLGAHSNLIQRVESQFLSTAGPEAKQKFDELLSGLMSGKVTVEDIRLQAQSAADQIRAAKKELGSEAGWAIDGYLAILDHFLKETGGSVAISTNSASSAAKPEAEAVPDKK
jgi:hypothetical protein